MERSENLKFYLDSIRSVQNYLVGFASVQSLAFLYELEKVGKYIYPIKGWIIFAIIAVVIVNWGVLFLAKQYELQLIKYLIKENEDELKQTKSIMQTALLWRGVLITAINGISAGIFYASSIM